MNMKRRRFLYNRKIQILKSGAKVQVCNKDKFIYRPSMVSGASEGELASIRDYGDVFPGKKRCKTEVFNNDLDGIVNMNFFDATHPLMFAPFCILPNRSCISGALNSGNLDGERPCEVVETCCNDGIDNDEDGLEDCNEPDCKKVLKKCKKAPTVAPGAVSYPYVESESNGVEKAVIFALATFDRALVGNSSKVCLRNSVTGDVSNSNVTLDPCNQVLGLTCPELVGSDESSIVLTTSSFDRIPTAAKREEATNRLKQFFPSQIDIAFIGNKECPF